MDLPDPPFEGAESFSTETVAPRRTPWPWRHLRLVVTGAALTVGFVLWFIGLDRYYEVRPALDRSGLDLVYEDLHLLVFGGAAEPPLPWQLEVARFLLPIAVAYGALAALLTLFRDGARLILLLFLRDHVIVVLGLNKSSAGECRTERRSLRPDAATHSRDMRALPA